MIGMSLLLGLLAMIGAAPAGVASSHADAGGLDLGAAVCTTTPGIAAASGPGAHVGVYYGPADHNPSGVLTVLNCTDMTLVKAVDRSRWARDRNPFLFDPKRFEKIPGMRGQYPYLNFNSPDFEHDPVLDQWSYPPTQAGDPWDGACVHAVEFTLHSRRGDTVFESDVNICNTDILILGWSPPTK
jgi:hypothetical protein